MYQKNRCHANFFSLKIAVWIFLFSLILPVTAAEEEGLSYEVIIDPQYEDAFSFSEGLAAVKKDGKWGYSDMEGNTVIPFQFDYAPSLVFDRTGKQVYLGAYWVGCCLNEGTFAATEAMGGNGLYLDESGKPVLEFSEEAYTRPFNQGLSPLAKYDVEREDFVFGFIDKNGKTVIPFEYDALGTFLEGLAFACKDGKYGVIDTQNNVVAPFEYTRITSYSNGLAVAVKDGRAFCVDRYGKEVPGSDTISQESYFPAGLESSLTMTPDEIITVIENGKYGFARIGYTQPLPQEGEMADWAYEEVIQAIQHDLVPSDLQNQYYANITRGDFATIVVQLLEVVSGDSIEDIVLEDTGKTLEELALAYPFSDTNSWDVVAANALGVINGRGEGIFDPYSAISRQDAAALLMRMGKYMGKTDVDTSGETFADNASVASYAQEAVAYVKALGVMNGTSETTFSPFDTYTRQQAYMTIWRLYNVMVTE